MPQLRSEPMVSPNTTQTVARLLRTEGGWQLPTLHLAEAWAASTARPSLLAIIHLQDSVGQYF